MIEVHDILPADYTWLGIWLKHKIRRNESKGLRFKSTLLKKKKRCCYSLSAYIRYRDFIGKKTINLFVAMLILTR